MEKNSLIEKFILSLGEGVSYLENGKKIIINSGNFGLGNETEEVDDELVEYFSNDKLRNHQLIIQDKEKFERTLQRYIDCFYYSNTLYTRGGLQRAFETIWFNLTNSDCDDLESFINRYISFIEDKTFSNLDRSAVIGNMNGYDIICSRKQADFTFETPYVLEFSLLSPDKRFFSLPKVRYAVQDTEKGKVAYVYAVQDVKLDEKNSDDQAIYEDVKEKIKVGKNKYTEISPLALVSLVIFIGMCDAENINRIKVSDFLLQRYVDKLKSSRYSEDELNAIQENLTNKLLSNFLRLSGHFSNIKVEAYPNDVDSFLHLGLDGEPKCNNTFLEQLYAIGLGIRNISQGNGSIGDNGDRVYLLNK